MQAHINSRHFGFAFPHSPCSQYEDEGNIPQVPTQMCYGSFAHKEMDKKQTDQP